MCTHLILAESIIIRNKYSSGHIYILPLLAHIQIEKLCGFTCRLIKNGVASDLNEIVLTLHLIQALFSLPSCL